MFSTLLRPGQGLWLRPCQGVHSFWMFYAIDVIFLDRELRTVKLVAGLRPFSLTMPRSDAWSVLEVEAGTIAGFGLKVGDQLRVEN